MEDWPLADSQAVLRTFSHGRLLCRSDFPVSHLRGRYVTIGGTFVWLHGGDFPEQVPYARREPILVGLNARRALHDAALVMRLSDAQVEAIFHNHAAELCSAATRPRESS